MIYQIVVKGGNIIAKSDMPDSLQSIKVGDQYSEIDLSQFAVHKISYTESEENFECYCIEDPISDVLSSVSQDIVTFVRESENMVQMSKQLYTEIDDTNKEVESILEVEAEINSGLQTVSTNMEEMVNAIREITRTTNESSAMSNEALELVQSTNKIMKNLGTSSEGVGNVIKLISSITQQTNLLALNATIEAARAGEAGKGFAVVANEVKELARQTAKATLEIRKKIESIQSDTKTAIDVIKEISTAVEKINGYAGNIAAAVEEQAATTDEVNRVVTEVENNSSTVESSIKHVSEIAKNTERIAGDTQKTSQNLGKNATKVHRDFKLLME